MTKQIVLARGVTLPLDVVNQTIGVIAKRRVGKSYTARRLAEQVYHAGVQLVIVDPKGDHWGIRSSADGKGPGIPIVIIGGEHGDVPLEVGSGEIVGKLVVEERASVLLDLSLLRKHEVATFMMMFLETVYRLKAREQYRTPLFMIIEEADEIAPQKPTPNQPNVARMLGAADDIVRRGGQRGIGVALITQRSAVINKNVLTQCEMLIALRTIAPQDREALEAWIDVHGTPEQREILMASLASLPKGDAWFWAPGWPTDQGIFKRAHVLPIETYDSGKSPEPGEKRKPPKQLADVDLAALTKQMASTIERAKADDPKALRGEIARLTKQLDQVARYAPKVPVVAEAKAAQKAVWKHQIEMAFERGRKAESKRWQPIVRMFTMKTETLLQTGRDLVAIGDRFGEEVRKASELTIVDDQPLITEGERGIPKAVAGKLFAESWRGPPVSWSGAAIERGKSDDGRLGSGERKILVAVARAKQGATSEGLSVITGYKKTSRDTYLQRLGAAGLVQKSDGRVFMTQAGLALLGDTFEELPTGRALLDHWLATLPPGERKILAAIAESHPVATTKDALSEQTGYRKTSRDTYLQRLSARKLVGSDRSGSVWLSESLAAEL